VKVGAGKPVQVPLATLEALTAVPTIGLPTTDGAAVLTGAPETGEVATELALAFPATFVAVTRTKSVWPASLAMGV
jgi:hypothetical protein